MPKTSKKAPFLIGLALILGILFLVAFIWHLHAGYYLKDIPLQEFSPYAIKPHEGPEREIAEKYLPRKPVIPKIYLPLRLTGIYKEKEEEIAYIENLMTSSTGQYKLGDEVLGARLTEILSGQVALLKDGRRIVLTLGGFYGDAPPDEWIGRVSEDSFIVSRPRLNERVRDINEVLSEGIPVPHIVDGRFDGFRLSSLREGGIVSQAGFQKDDIVRSINGQRIDSLKKPVQIYRHLKELVEKEDAPVIKIELKRKNNPRTFTFRILKD